MILTCVEGCSASFDTGEVQAVGARYRCPSHIGPDTSQHSHFQQMQFDPTLAFGTDPIQYMLGHRSHVRVTDKPPETNSAWKRFKKKAKSAIRGHRNEIEITKVLFGRDRV